MFVVLIVTSIAEDTEPVLPAASVAVAVRLWVPLREGAGGVAPGAGAIGGGGTEQGGAVIDLDGAARLGGARQSDCLLLLTIASVEIDGATGASVSTVTLRAVEATPVLPATSVAVAVRLWVPLVRAAGGVAPGAGAIGGGGTEQGGAVIDLDGAVRLGGAVEGQRVVAGDVVADGAAYRWRRRRCWGPAGPRCRP